MIYKEPSPDEIPALLREVKTIALIGASQNKERPSYDVMRFLQRRGYRVIPVNPGLEGQELLGEKIYGSLKDIGCSIDMLDIFRNSEAANDVINEAILLKERLGLKIIWTQLGVYTPDAGLRAEAAGLRVVMNKCPKIELSV